VQEIPVAVLHAGEEPPARLVQPAVQCPSARGVPRPGAQDSRAEHRHHRQRYRQRAQQGERHDDGELFEHHAGHAPHEHQGQEHHDGRQRTGDDRRRDLIGAVHGGLLDRLAGLVNPVNVLEHDDGVVHQHADAQRQATQRHDVQRQVIEVQQGEGRDDGNGNRGGDDDGASNVAQEQQQDDDGQQAAVHGRASHIADRILDVLRRINDRDDPDLRDVPVDAFQLGQSAPGHVDGVLARLLAYRHANPRFAVYAHDAGNPLPGVLDQGDLLQLDGRALAHRNDRVLQLPQVRVLTGGADGDFVIALFDASGRDVHVALADL